MDESKTTRQKVEDMIDYAMPIIERWPKLHRYTLGERIVNQMYDIAELCTAAQMKYFKKTTMQDIDIKKEQLLQMVRRASRTQYDARGRDGATVKKQLLPVQNYEAWSEKILEIGRLLGGWIKSVSERRDGKPQGRS